MSQRTLVVMLACAVGVLAISAGLMLRMIYDGRTATSGTGPTLVTSVAFGGPFELTDYNGDTITEAAFEGQPSLLFFGFTHCPDVCPTTVYDIETWFQELGPEAEEVNAYFVTVDPERDTAEFLSDYLKPQSDRVIGITGEPEAVWDMARSWRVYWQKRPLGEGDYTMDHFASVYVLDRDGNLFEKIAYGENPETAKAKILAAVNS